MYIFMFENMNINNNKANLLKVLKESASANICGNKGCLDHETVN